MNTINYHEGMWVLSPAKELGTLTRKVQSGFGFQPIWATETNTAYITPDEINGFKPVALQRGDWVLYNCERYQVKSILLDGNTVVFKLLSSIGSRYSFVNYKELMLNHEILKSGYGF